MAELTDAAAVEIPEGVRAALLDLPDALWPLPPEAAGAICVSENVFEPEQRRYLREQLARILDGRNLGPFWRNDARPGWVPAVPLPWIYPWGVRCDCRRTFLGWRASAQRRYAAHYRAEHQ